MNKNVQIKILKIKYDGDSVGDDIHIEIDILSQHLYFDKKIKAGTISEINKEIGIFETDQKTFLANLRITVVEKDLLFNDVGNTDDNIKVDTTIVVSQHFVYKVQIKETRSVLGKVWGKSIANFEISLEAVITDAVKYIPDQKDGWLKVRIESTKSVESLPAYLKVKIDHADNKREYFTVLEGIHRGKLASIKLQEAGSSQFISNIQHESGAYIIYSISKKTVTLIGKKYKTVDYKNAQWKKGLYDIEIPDTPHRGRLNNKIKMASVWFRIGHGGDKYLHTGQVSLGCITVVENNSWIEIYNNLIKSRKGDFKSVGVLEVVD